MALVCRAARWFRIPSGSTTHIRGRSTPGRSREGGKTHPAASRITAYAQNKGSCNPALRGLQLPGIFCHQEALFGISRNGIGRRPAGNEDFNNRVAAQTVAAMDAAGHLARSVQAGG